MPNLDYMDLEILYQAKKSKNGITPETVSKPDVFTPGIWKLVDRLTTLEEKNLLAKNKDGLYQLTKKGTNTFWHIESPLWFNILKLLQVKAFSDVECASYLGEPIPAVQQALDMIVKKGYVMMSPLRKDERLLKMYEILPEGLEQLSQHTGGGVFVVKSGNKLIVELDDGDGILYEIVEDLVNPLRMIKTLSESEIKEYK